MLDEKRIKEAESNVRQCLSNVPKTSDEVFVHKPCEILCIIGQIFLAPLFIDNKLLSY
jgi:hypothetical protein